MWSALTHVCVWGCTNTQLYLGSQNHPRILCQLSYHKPRKLVKDLILSHFCGCLLPIFKNFLISVNKFFAFFCLTNTCWYYVSSMAFSCNPFTYSFCHCKCFFLPWLANLILHNFWIVLKQFIYLFIMKIWQNTLRKNHRISRVVFLPRHDIVCSNQPQIYN